MRTHVLGMISRAIEDCTGGVGGWADIAKAAAAAAETLERNSVQEGSDPFRGEGARRRALDRARTLQQAVQLARNASESDPMAAINLLRQAHAKVLEA